MMRKSIHCLVALVLIAVTHLASALESPAVVSPRSTVTLLEGVGPGATRARSSRLEHAALASG